MNTRPPVVNVARTNSLQLETRRPKKAQTLNRKLLLLEKAKHHLLALMGFYPYLYTLPFLLFPQILSSLKHRKLRVIGRSHVLANSGNRAIM